MITVNDFFAEYELVGWMVETRFWLQRHNKFTIWESHWNHKLYKTELDAKQAMEMSGIIRGQQEYRYRPIYAKK